MEPRGMAGKPLMAIAVAVLIVGCGPSTVELQKQLDAKQAELDQCKTDLDACKQPQPVKPPLPPSPIEVEPGGGGNLRWTQDGVDLAPGASLKIRDDFAWKAEYLKVKLADGTWPPADWVKFKVTSGSVTGTVQIWAGGGVFQWHFANDPLHLCDFPPDDDPVLGECEGGGIASELYGTLSGSMTAKLTDAGVVTVQAARMAPR